MSCGVSHARSWDLALLWLWRGPAAAAPTGPLAWELPYAAGAALEKTKKINKLFFLKKVQTLHVLAMQTVGRIYFRLSFSRKRGCLIYSGFQNANSKALYA